jgi:hypothetical protein
MEWVLVGCIVDETNIIVRWLASVLGIRVECRLLWRAPDRKVIIIELK